MRQFYVFLSCFLLTTLMSYAQPANYAWIAEFDGNYGNTRSFSDGAAGANIRTLTVQADSNDDEFVVEWNSFGNKWFNISSPYNSIFTLEWGGGNFNGPNSILSSPATNGKYYTIQIDGLDYSDRQAVIMETTGAPVGFDSGSATVQTPSNNITGSTPVTVFGTLDATAPNSELRVFIRYSTDGFTTSNVVEMSNSLPNEVDGVIPGQPAGTTVNYYLFTTTVDASTITNESEYDLVTIDLENNGGSNYSYTVVNNQTTANSGNWNDVATWTSGSVPNTDDVVILNHTITINSDVVHSGNITINSPNVLSISPGHSLKFTGSTFTNNGGVLMTSSSSTFSSFIPSTSSTLDGTGGYEYFRYTNSNTNGNDLISPPVSGQSWSDFLSSGSNAGNLLDDGNSSPTTYAFAPFDKSVGDYVNYTDATVATLIPGVGYRAATDSGTLLSFTGSVETGTVFNDIQNSGPAFQEWNLIGNPYPSYIDAEAFLTHTVSTQTTGERNIDLMDALSGIYGYDGDASNGWDIITLANDAGRLIAPGQGFFVAVNDTGSLIADHDIEFTAAMRTTGTADDFIADRNSSSLTYLKLIALTANDDYTTDFYFDADASIGLDPGYEAVIWGGVAPSFALYSHLVQDNTGLPIALQALGATDYNDVTIALGVNANMGEQLTFSIEQNTLPASIDVYLDDALTSTSTLLNTSDYVLTPAEALNGTGRFYLRFTNSALSLTDNVLDGISIYTNQTLKTINIAGTLNAGTIAKVYDLQGRLVHTTALDENTTLHTIDANSLHTGVYIVNLVSGNHSKTKKVILK